VLALCIAVLPGIFWMLRWPFQPMQDLGHHMADSAIAADYSRPGSIYPALYTPLDRLCANSLMWSLAGLMGHVISVTLAVRICLLAYVAGTPFAVLVALRAFGRSAWPAVATAALVYAGLFAAGFANLLFAAPFFVVALAQFGRTLERTSRKRALWSGALFVLVFLAHAHAWMWLGALSMMLTARALMVAAWQRKGGRYLLQLCGWSLGCVALSLLLFARWYHRTFMADQTGLQRKTAGLSEGFGAVFKSFAQSLHDLPEALQAQRSGNDLMLLALFFVLAGFALSAQMIERKRSRILELCCLVTAASYFFLPEWMSGHESIASRQPCIALWIFPALLEPVSAALSPRVRRVVIGGTLALTAAWLFSFGTALWHFETEEAAGLAEVLDAAPPRAMLHMVKLDPDSRYFTWHSLWHVEKYVMSEKLGQTPDTTGILTTSPIHYLPGINIHRVTQHTNDWPGINEIWTAFDVVLVRRWRPSPRALQVAQMRGHLLAKSGDWELWSTKQ